MGENKSAAKGKGKAAVPAQTTKLSGRNKAPRESKSATAIPDVFQDMLVEALSLPHVDVSEARRKRRRIGRPGDEPLGGSARTSAGKANKHDEGGEFIEFEDVIPLELQQTAYNDSDDTSGESDVAWEEVGVLNYSVRSSDGEDDDGDLDLTLARETSPQRRSAATRRKAVTKAERTRRLEIHKMHLLCLLAHVDRRNDWCNDSEVQNALRPLLSKQILDCLKPKQDYTQFGRAESVKKGLALASKMWDAKFTINERGMRRPFWAEDEQEIKNFKLPPDSDHVHEKAEFRVAAKNLKGSRDVGAQLFCTLLRSAGLEARLVCSLQPLPFSATVKATTPSTLGVSPIIAKSPTPVSEDKGDVNVESVESPFGSSGPSVSDMPFTARRRLGHPNAADYFMPLVSPPARLPPKPKQKRIRESPYPIFWIEVLDEAHQKWMPVNPVDPTSINNPRKFEPPASEAENALSYVIVFEDDGAARDVTRRYAKTFNAKTRKNRVESTDGGYSWWRKTLRFYSRGWKNDLDQIEDTELAAAEAREPMPRSVADFKDHPIYALERHLRRNEVLVRPREVGKVAAGRDTGGGKTLERVYRRADVKVAKSADGWYRMGREVKVGEQPVKIVVARRQGNDMEDDEESAGTGLYTESQTELYQSPPVVNGQVPKNSYGNLDVYVPSMVPRGGVHIPYPEASRAARILRLDYADAVTGFEFRGRHGTAIIKGIVAAEEYKEALMAVIEGFRDEKEQAKEEMRSLAALQMWKKFIVGLRIKERVDSYDIEGEGPTIESAEEDSGMDSEEYIDDGGGGFFPE